MTVEGQIARMQKLHGDIKRLSADVTNGIDDISRYISMQYMKKKTNEIKMQRSALGGTTVNPSAITSVRNLSLKPGQEGEFRGSDLFNNHPAIHGYGKIDPSEKSFESLGKQTGERSGNQNYQPL